MQSRQLCMWMWVFKLDKCAICCGFDSECVLCLCCGLVCLNLNEGIIATKMGFSFVSAQVLEHKQWACVIFQFNIFWRGKGGGRVMVNSYCNNMGLGRRNPKFITKENFFSFCLKTLELFICSAGEDSWVTSLVHERLAWLLVQRSSSGGIPLWGVVSPGGL